jgi:hypothetical protein
MKRNRMPFPRALTLTAALLLAAFTALPAGAQGNGPSPCVTRGNSAAVPSSGTCTFQGVSATFGGSAGGTATLSTRTINLTSGWVYIAPGDDAGNGAPDYAGGPRTPPPPPPVTVSTTYTTTLSESPVDWSGHWWSLPGRDRHVTVPLSNASGAGTYAVMVGADSATVVLISGTMSSPAGLLPGCQVTYNGPDEDTGIVPIASTAVESTLTSGGQLETLVLPQTCFCPDTVQVQSEEVVCSLGGYTAVFAEGASATIGSTTSIDLTAGSVALSSYNGGTAPPVTVTTSYEAIGGAEVFTVSAPTNTGPTPPGRPNPSFLVGVTEGSDSAFVAVETGAVTATLATSDPVTRGYQMTYWDATSTRPGHRRRSPINPIATAVLCGMGMLLPTDPDCQ